MINKIFIIGFNKCGTRTLHHFFKKNGLNSCHYICKNNKSRNIASCIYRNKQEGKLLLDCIDNYDVYSDMENIHSTTLLYAQYLFKELDKQYPNSKFILNTRNVEKWLTSRQKHQGGKGIYVKKCKKKLGLNDEEIFKHWEKEWYDHHIDVIEYFIDRPDDLLIFDIEQESPDKIVDFFKGHIELDASKYTHRGKTSC